MYRRWTSRYHFGWRRRLSFERRRLDLMSWLEDTAQPVGFAVTDDAVGVALGSADVRLSVFESGMTLSRGWSHTAPVVFGDALQGVFEILAPEAVDAQRATLRSSMPLDEDYASACSRFARETSFGTTDTGWVPTDSSVLLDLEHGDTEAQIEWGVVTGSELLERVTGEVGRLDNRLSGRVDAGDSGPDDLPEVALFAECGLVEQSPPRLDSPHAVLAQLLQWDEMAATLTTALHAAFATRDRKSA